MAVDESPRRDTYIFEHTSPTIPDIVETIISWENNFPLEERLSTVEKIELVLFQWRRRNREWIEEITNGPF